MECVRMLMPLACAGALLAACGGGSDVQKAETASADSSARVADSMAKAARTGPQRLANVMIGKRLGPQNRIAEPTFQFGPEDTVFVSVGVEGTPGDGSLAARWLAQTGKTLDSTAAPIDPADSGNTEFHLMQEKGWKPGTYLVTLFLNGDSVDAKTFAVRK